MMIIEGTYDPDTWYGEVRINNKLLSPKRSQRVYSHSPDGFAWGYGGSGPSQLALAILLEAGLGNNEAVELHQAFKWKFLAPASSRAPLALTIDIEDWIRTERLERRNKLREAMRDNT